MSERVIHLAQRGVPCSSQVRHSAEILWLLLTDKVDAAKLETDIDGVKAILVPTETLRFVTEYSRSVPVRKLVSGRGCRPVLLLLSRLRDIAQTGNIANRRGTRVTAVFATERRPVVADSIGEGCRVSGTPSHSRRASASRQRQRQKRRLRTGVKDSGDARQHVRCDKEALGVGSDTSTKLC